MFSFDARYFHLFSSSFHKQHRMNSLQSFCLFLPFVFMENYYTFAKQSQKRIGMKHRQHTLQSIIIEVVIVLLASIISFPLSDIVGVSLSALPLVIVVCYVILKSIYHLCISLSAYTIELTSSFIPNNRTRMNVPLKEFLQEQVIMKS